jgi:hypothetical protein
LRYVLQTGHFKIVTNTTAAGSRQRCLIDVRIKDSGTKILRRVLTMICFN